MQENYKYFKGSAVRSPPGEDGIVSRFSGEAALDRSAARDGRKAGTGGDDMIKVNLDSIITNFVH